MRTTTIKASNVQMNACRVSVKRDRMTRRIMLLAGMAEKIADVTVDQYQTWGRIIAGYYGAPPCASVDYTMHARAGLGLIYAGILGKRAMPSQEGK